MRGGNTPVLVVGAGPTGLMMACQLARHGVPHRIIDYKPGPTKESRALAVQARALEAYAQLGLADRALSSGALWNGIVVYNHGAPCVTVPIANIGQGLTPFPTLLALEQSKNEALLVARLREFGAQVEWETRFVQLEERQDHVLVTVAKESEGAQEQTFEAKYVVACDGATSAVRKALRAEFSGGTYANTFYVADLDIDGNIDHTMGGVFFSNAGFALTLPMPGSPRRFRLVGIVPGPDRNRDYHRLLNPPFASIRDQLHRILVPNAVLHDPSWYSTYRVHHRKVAAFKVGRILLAGDAAHVHSPAGGQGMNTGLLDAHNLGWKLAYSVLGIAEERIIDTYHEERNPFAEKLLSTTDRAFRALSRPLPRVVLYVLSWVMRLVLMTRFGRTLLFKTVSQTGIQYRGMTLAREEGRARNVRAGDRFPSVKVRESKGTESWSLDWFKRTGFWIVDFRMSEASPTAERGETVATSLTDMFGVDFHYVAAQVVDGCAGVAKRDLGPLVYVVRPDMYVGLVSENLAVENVAEYMASKLGLKPRR